MANDTKYGYLISPAPQFLDTNGKPISGGKLKVYIAGTTTKATTYSDWNLTKNTWPIVLDSMGTCQVIVSSANLYKFVLESAEGEEPLVTRDNVAVAYANVDITGIGSEVVNSDGSVDVTATTDPDTGRTTYDVSVKDTVQDLEGLIEDETDRATAAEKAAKTEIVAGDNISVTKTVGADGQDVYTIDGEENLVDDVRVNGTSVVTDKVANIDVPVAGTASPLMDGTASAGASGKFAREDHVHPSDTSREAVANKTTVVLGTSDSKYPTDKAVADFVNSSVATNTAYYISDDGEPFTSVEELEAYSGTVTNNDYAFVTGTDSAGNTYYDRYKATVRGSTVTWALEYRLNNSSFTAAQWEAINSGITAALVGKIHEHSNKAVLDGITATDVSNWNGKLDKNGNGSDVTVGFTEATSRTNIATGSKLSTLFGQIRKWLSDLKALAFKDKVGTSDVESGTYPINISGNATTCTYPYGFATRTSTLPNWGTLKDSTKYDLVTAWGGDGGTEIVFAKDKSTPSGHPNKTLSVQVDGYFYQNEGTYRVLDTSDVTSTYSPTGTAPVNGIAVAEAVAGVTTWMTDAEALQLWTDAWNAAT